MKHLHGRAIGHSREAHSGRARPWRPRQPSRAPHPRAKAAAAGPCRTGSELRAGVSSAVLGRATAAGLQEDSFSGRGTSQRQRQPSSPKGRAPQPMPQGRERRPGQRAGLRSGLRKCLPVGCRGEAETRAFTLTSVKKEKLPQKGVEQAHYYQRRCGRVSLFKRNSNIARWGGFKWLVFLEAYVTHSLNKHSLKASPVPESPFNSLRNKAS